MRPAHVAAGPARCRTRPPPRPPPPRPASRGNAPALPAPCRSRRFRPPRRSRSDRRAPNASSPGAACAARSMPSCTGQGPGPAAVQVRSHRSSASPTKPRGARRPEACANLEDRASRRRGLTPTGLANQTVPRGSAGRPGLAPFVAGPLGGKPRLEFNQCPWVILIQNFKYNVL